MNKKNNEQNQIRHIDNWTDYDDLHEKYRFYIEADLNHCRITADPNVQKHILKRIQDQKLQRDYLIKEIAWAWTNPKSSLEGFKESYLGYCMYRLDSYHAEVRDHIIMRYEELVDKEVSHV